MSLGILGGTFNPPHRGHLALARHARAELGLEQVLLMPAHMPPHKPAGEDPGAEHRLRMCKLAVAGEDGIAACAQEVERGGTSYTVDTLQSIHAQHPEARLTFIVGADTARTLGSWRDPHRVLELARLAVATRAHSGRREVLEALAAVFPAPQRGPGRKGSGEALEQRVSFLAMPAIDVSSSMVRQRIARGQPVDELVAPAVAGYIAAHGLYGARIGAAR